MRADRAIAADWRDDAAYAPLLGADRSLFAWEWLRRDPNYRAAADHSLSSGAACREDEAAASFGLVSFEAPDRAVPHARPLWRADAHPPVLVVRRVEGALPADAFAVDQLAEFATLIARENREYLLLSDGLRTIRLDAARGTFGDGPVCLGYQLQGLVTATPLVLSLRRFLALCRTGRFARSLHPCEPRARRWILILRAWDALAAGADQRQIAEVLLSGSAGAPRWRSREPSLRSQAQRLVRSARSFAAGGYQMLLLDRPARESGRSSLSPDSGARMR